MDEMGVRNFKKLCQRFAPLCSILVFTIAVFFAGCRLIHMMTDEDTPPIAAIKEQEEVTLIGLGKAIYYWIWPKPLEEPEYNFFQRLWMYLN